MSGEELYREILGRNTGPMYREKWEAAFLGAYSKGLEESRDRLMFWRVLALLYGAAALACSVGWALST